MVCAVQRDRRANGNLAATVGEVLAYVDVPTPDEITTLLAYASAQYGVSGS